VVLAPISGHPWDTYVWYQTGRTILQGGNIYGLQAGYAYPPLWAGFLGVTNLAYGLLASFFGAHPMPQETAKVLLGTGQNLGAPLVPDWLFLSIVKAPLILFDCLTAFLLYRIVNRRFNDPKAASRAFSLFFLNPLVIWVSSVWGMFDVLPTYFALLGTLLFLDRRGMASGLAFGVAVALKYFPVLLLFALLIGYRRNLDTRFVRALSASFLALLMIVSIPFLIMDGGSYVTGILSPVSGQFVGNMSIWLVAPILGFASIPTWIVALDVATILLLTGIVSWSLGKLRKAADVPTLWTELSLCALLAFYLLYRTINEQYILWITPFLTLDVVLGRERWMTLVWVSVLPVLHSILALGGTSFFLPILTFAPQLGPFIPIAPDWPILLNGIGIIFWLSLFSLFLSRLKRWGRFRTVFAVFVMDAKRVLSQVWGPTGARGVGPPPALAPMMLEESEGRGEGIRVDPCCGNAREPAKVSARRAIHAIGVHRVPWRTGRSHASLRTFPPAPRSPATGT
jgi:hypothetical protein